MRIISKFQDYYDSGLAYGIDQDIVYERHTDHNFIARPTNGSNTELLRVYDERPFFRYVNNNKRYYSRGGTACDYLHFCGKRYTFFFYNEDYNVKLKSGLKEIRHRAHYFWTPEQIEGVLEVPHDNSYHMKHSGSNYDNVWDTPDTTLNEEYNSPIVLEFLSGLPANLELPWSRDSFLRVINPCLKDIKFQTRIDPYQAFQEISMYLSMLQNPEDKDLDPEATDVEKVRQHGMDEKYGFRKMPSK